MMREKCCRAHLILALLLSAPAVMAAQQVLVLQNGDRVTGVLKEISGENWTFSLASGDLTMPINEIAAFTASEPIGVRLDDGTIVAGTVATVDNAFQLTLSDGATRTVPITGLVAIGDPGDLQALRPVHISYFTPFSKFWGATLSFGFSNNSGNSRSRGVAFSFDVERKSPKDRQAIKGGLSREFAPGASGDLETNVEKYYGSVRLDLFISPKLFTFGSAGYDRDTFQDLNLRQNYTVGLGYQVIENDKTDLRLFGSGGGRFEKFTSGGSTSTGIVSFGGGYRQSLGPVLFDWSGSWAPSVEDVKDYRIISESSLSTKILGGLGFRIASLNQFNNNPRPGVKKHDWLFTTQLSYSVGR
jgi:putative salt-induced outer membrane protein YdiY/small nuclear ribonucleoprotein (snRNP)-like protein